MGKNSISLIAEPAKNQATVSCEKAFTLILNGKELAIPAGSVVVALN